MALFVGAIPIEYVLARVLNPWVFFILPPHSRDRLHHNHRACNLAREHRRSPILGRDVRHGHVGSGHFRQRDRGDVVVLGGEILDDDAGERVRWETTLALKRLREPA